jgi:hypothetical protein
MADVGERMSARIRPARSARRPLVVTARVGTVALGLSVGQWATPAAAYRPFDGTDAAVADVNEVEIELQPVGSLLQGGQTSLVAPHVIYNYGFAERWEFVAEGQFETPLSPTGPTSLTDTAMFLKHVVQPGVLQGQSGLSIATEFGVLLPGINSDRGTGASVAGIVSQRWDWGTVHLNVATNLTRDQRGELFLDAIIEGPSKWKVRPVFEIFSDSVWAQTQTYSALAGFIWQVRDNLAFDAAVRYAFVNGRPVSELRLGVTFGFSLAKLRPAADFLPALPTGNGGMMR